MVKGGVAERVEVARAVVRAVAATVLVMGGDGDGGGGHRGAVRLLDQRECHGGLTLAAALVRLVELLLGELAVAKGHVKVGHRQQLLDPPLRWARRRSEVARRQHTAANRATNAAKLRVEGRCGLGLLGTAADLARKAGGVVPAAACTGGGGSCGSCGGGGGGGGGGALAGWRRRRGICESDALYFVQEFVHAEELRLSEGVG